jgi:hypothetical protein
LVDTPSKSTKGDVESTQNTENIASSINNEETKKIEINLDDLDSVATSLKEEQQKGNEEIIEKEKEKEEEDTDELFAQDNLFMTDIPIKKTTEEVTTTRSRRFSAFQSNITFGLIKKETDTNNENKIENHPDINENDDDGVDDNEENDNDNEQEQNNFAFSQLNKVENNEINIDNYNYDNNNIKENTNKKTNTNKDGLNQNNNKKSIKSRLLSQSKTHIMIRFDDKDPKNNVICKFMCNVFWASQFEALREGYLSEEENSGFIASLSLSKSWDSGGGKSGASFSKSLDDRFIIKAISNVEMAMFLDFAPSYFKHMSSAIIDKSPTILCKILGRYYSNLFILFFN